MSTWRILSWPFRWIIVKTDEHPDFVTAIGTFVIAVFTIVLAVVGHRQLSAIRDQLTETQKEFRFTQRAQIVLGNQTGTMMEIAYFNGKPKVVVYMRNEGSNPAHDVVPDFKVLTAAPTKPETLQYMFLHPHPERGIFGPTWGSNIPFVSYLPLTLDQATATEAGTMQMRVVGRITYWDDFNTYCIPVGTVYFLDPPRFEPYGIPPKSAICHPTTESEVFSVTPQGGPGLQFRYPIGEIPVDTPQAQGTP